MYFYILFRGVFCTENTPLYIYLYFTNQIDKQTDKQRKTQLRYILTKFTEFTFKRSGSLFPQMTRHVKRKTMLTVFNNINIVCFK